MSNNQFTKVYIGGACSSNGRSGARAGYGLFPLVLMKGCYRAGITPGYGVYWGPDHPLNVSSPVSGGRATNNTGEIQAATRAMQQAYENGIPKVEINTDSKFLIDSATKWMPGWKQNGWKLASGEPVKNERDFRELDRAARNVEVKWRHVPSHQGVHGNEMADKLAKAGASKYY